MRKESVEYRNSHQSFKVLIILIVEHFPFFIERGVSSIAMKPSSGAIYCLDFGYPPTPSSLVNWIQWEHDVRNNCWMKFLASGGDGESRVGRELSCFLSGNLCCSTHIGLSETELKRCALVQKFVLGWVTLSILSTLLCWHYDVMLF